MKNIIGVDCDGVLSDFVTAFNRLAKQTFNKDLPYADVWDWYLHYGISKDEEKVLWDLIKTSPSFWQEEPPFDTTAAVGDYLRDRISDGDDVYFISDRPGSSSKLQTERWLRRYLKLNPTVIISRHKGLIARALGLTHYIDDRIENVQEVVLTGTTKTFLMDRPWNREFTPGYETAGIIRTTTVVGLCD